MIEQHTQSQPHHSHQSIEVTRNRRSQRLIQVFTPPDNLDPKWSNVGCVIRVQRTGTRGSIPDHHVGYYLSSLAPHHAPRLAAGIRAHWQIENRLHWVKDVVYQEDSRPQLPAWAAINFSLLKTWVLSLLRIHGHDSLTEAISFLSHNIKYILSLCH